jgi:hypothetical protein
MAYDPPTVESFRDRFPEFDVDTIDDTVVQMLLDEAGRFVDTTWTEGDYAIAIRLLAAHFAQMEINGAGGSGSGGSNTQTTETLNLGPITISTRVGASASSFGFDSTAYGRQYLQLLALNQPSVMIV